MYVYVSNIGDCELFGKCKEQWSDRQLIEVVYIYVRLRLDCNQKGFKTIPIQERVYLMVT
jgi:hypothetical protein